MALHPLSELISDKNLSDRLREIGEVSVVAGYEFLQWDSGIYDISLMAELDIYGAFDNGRLIGIIGIHREKQHISLFLYRSNTIGKG